MLRLSADDGAVAEATRGGVTLPESLFLSSPAVAEAAAGTAAGEAGTTEFVAEILALLLGVELPCDALEIGLNNIAVAPGPFEGLLVVAEAVALETGTA